MGLFIIIFFFTPCFFLFIQIHLHREDAVNIKSIINIYNLHILKILSITEMWGDKLTAAAWSGCDLHATESLRLPSPVLFLTLHACLFSVQIKNRSFVLVEDRCFFFPLSLSLAHTHTQHNTQTHRGSIDAQC